MVLIDGRTGKELKIYYCLKCPYVKIDSTFGVEW
jgi:hypothetical protein